MRMQELSIRNPELIKKLDALALKVDQLFDDRELMNKLIDLEYKTKNPKERVKDNKDEAYIAAPHWDILPWNMNDELKSGQMNPIGLEYLNYQKDLMKEKGPNHHETKGFPNLEPFVTGKKLWERDKDYDWFRDMVYDISHNWLGGSAMALCAFYEPGGHIPWHHNGNAPGNNILLHYNKEGSGSFYTYDDGEIVEYKDSPGWVARAGIFYDTVSNPDTYTDKIAGKFGKHEQTYTTPILADNESASWHCANAVTRRFTLSTVVPDKMIWEDLCEEIEEA